MNKTLKEITFIVKYPFIKAKAKAKHEMALLCENTDGTHSAYITKVQTQAFTLTPTVTQQQKTEESQ